MWTRYKAMLGGLLNGIVSSVVCMLVFAGIACAQDRLVPAGTLLQCTLDEPNWSSATPAPGDPVLCHLRTLEQFGRPVFPKGAMLGGHLEDVKDPGHSSGKGYVKMTFDRVILPYGDLPVPAKVIHAKRFNASKTGDINAKRHSEWLMPPLWTWKIVSLPMRGPHPPVKGAEQLELRIMDDVLIPATLVYGPMKRDRLPYMGSAQQSVVADSEAKPALGWKVIQPVLDGWKGLPSEHFPNYAAGSWGLAAADELLARDGRAWRTFEEEKVPSEASEVPARVGKATAGVH